MKFAFYEVIDWEANYIRERLPNHELSFFRTPIKKGEVLEDKYDAVSVFVASDLPAQFFENNKSVKCIATRSTGFDHIDIHSAKTAGVSVTNVPTYGENTVAEYTFALLLAISKKIYQSVKRVREQAWFSYEGLRGFDLKGKTIGVVGTGHIGLCVIKIAKGFEMNVVAYDPYPNAKLAGNFGFEYVSFEDLLKRSDIVTLHAPYLPTTHHMLNAETFKFMKPGMVVINTARGALIETEALVEALRNGIVAGAGLDVLEEEGFIKDEMEMMHNGHPTEVQLKTILADHELMYMDNVIVTPHNAFQTTEAIRRILDTTIDNIASFADGKPMNVVSA